MNKEKMDALMVTKHFGAEFFEDEPFYDFGFFTIDSQGLDALNYYLNEICKGKTVQILVLEDKG